MRLEIYNPDEEIEETVYLDLKTEDNGVMLVTVNKEGDTTSVIAFLDTEGIRISGQSFIFNKDQYGGFGLRVDGSLNEMNSEKAGQIIKDQGKTYAKALALNILRMV